MRGANQMYRIKFYLHESDVHSGSVSSSTTELKSEPMRKLKLLALGAAIIASSAAYLYLRAADHIDGSAIVAGQAHDITDFYAFESPENSDNYVFAVNVQGLVPPSATDQLAFSEDVMFEINLDTDADLVEDLLIQAVFYDGSVVVYGPTAASAPGLNSTIETSGIRIEAPITAYGQSPQIVTQGGIKVFAGPRDDPFFMNLFRFIDIIDGVFGVENPPTSFNEDGTDSLAGTNVLSLVIEVPKSQLGSSSTFSTWVETKTKI